MTTSRCGCVESGKGVRGDALEEGIVTGRGRGSVPREMDGGGQVRVAAIEGEGGDGVDM